MRLVFYGFSGMRYFVGDADDLTRKDLSALAKRKREAGWDVCWLAPTKIEVTHDEHCMGAGFYQLRPVDWPSNQGEPE